MTVLGCRLELLFRSPQGGPGVWLHRPRRLWCRVEILPWQPTPSPAGFPGTHGSLENNMLEFQSWGGLLCPSSHPPVPSEPVEGRPRVQWSFPGQPGAAVGLHLNSPCSPRPPKPPRASHLHQMEQSGAPPGWGKLSLFTRAVCVWPKLAVASWEGRGLLTPPLSSLSNSALLWNGCKESLPSMEEPDDARPQ